MAREKPKGDAAANVVASAEGNLTYGCKNCGAIFIRTWHGSDTTTNH